ncbi:hypothetical protein Phi46:3_gp101 [Cellulophaga phage phi46:3]|uniref:Uncharacterized protein n=1 Tax=Cellulophaga phage phi46:3 TaxID=1327985 RepID=S0A217_9CAUD|nr:hypothetical protein Phi46:3_gp101 [Cellulophaga phage phi46:3]AGO48845.1 hypothetical protein Phi46:3_gp101 [Cellulophaga phage phi46:3]
MCLLFPESAKPLSWGFVFLYHPIIFLYFVAIVWRLYEFRLTA